MALTSEAKVGALFFLGLGLALWFALFVGDIGGGDGNYRIRFQQVSGLDRGSAVTFNGVPVGTVRRVEPELVAGQPMVAVWFDINPADTPAVIINADTTFKVRQPFIGSAALSIVTNGSGEVISNERLEQRRGSPEATLGDVIEQVQDILSENRADLRSTIAGLPGAVDEFTRMSSTVADLVEENREVVGEAIASFRDASRSIDTLVTENREAVNGALVRIDEAASEIRDLVAENRPDIRSAVEQFPAAVANIRDAAGELRDVVGENRDDVRTLMANLASFAPKLDRIGTDVEDITDQISSGQGTLGRLVYEDTLHERTVSAVDSLGQRMEEVKPFTAGFSDLRFYGGIEAGSNIGDERFRGKAYLRIEPRPWKFYRVGVSYLWDYSDRELADEDPNDFNVDIDLTFGWRFFPDNDNQRYGLSVQGGLIESALGAQVDFPIYGPVHGTVMARAKRNTFEEDERQFEEGSDPFVRAYLEWKVWKGISVLAGAEDLADSPEPWIGVRAEILDNDLRNFSNAAAIAP